MDFVKPLWLSHTTVGAGGKQSGQESSIFTLDVGSGDRLATGGLDCTVRVWNTSAFNSFSNDSSVPPAIHSNGHNFQKPEKDENLYNFSQPEQAKSFNNLEDFEKIDISPPQVDETLKAVMARHNGAVLCARWAPLLTNGPFICNRQLLATGSDDSIILIWQRTPNTPGNLEAGGLQCSESYSVIHRLTGHASDVNGVEWSHDGRYLASSGLDGCVIIWNAQSFLLHKRLESNPSRPLKGVAWDPRGEFVSAQSNEGHLYIWRTSDWRLESIFSTPYTTIPIEGYTYFARPSWSPDGCVICVPDIVNGQDTVAALVERGTWATEQSLVGHACSVQVCSFSPHLYVPTQNQLRVSETLIESQNYIMLIAMGSQDGVLSLWATNETRPIAVVAGLFDHAIMDISWDPMHPLILYVSSYNGTVVKVSIPHDFIEPLPTDQKNIILKAIAEGVRGANESRSLLNLPTSATQVTLQTDTMGSIECAIAVADKLKGETPTSETKIEQKLPAIQTTTVGGKRRITPQLVQPPISSILSDHRSESHKNPAFSLSNQPLTPSVQYSIAIGRPLRKAWLKVPQPQISILTGPFEITNKKSATNNDSFICHISSPSDVSKEYNITWEESLDGVLITNAVAFHFEVMNYSKDTHRHSTIDTEKKVHLESSAKRFKVGLIVSTNDNRIHMFSETGRRLMPPLVVPSAVTFLAVNTDSDETIQIHTSKYANEYPLKKNQSDGPSPSYCAAVLDNGLFFIWTLPTMDVLVADEICPGNFCGDLLGISIRTVLESTVKIYVEFNLSNNSSLLYSASQKLFVDLTPKTDADSLAIECLYGLKETNFNENEVLTAVNRLLSAADSVVLRRASTAFLEAQVGAANLLRDVQRLMGWVPALAHRLSVDESYAKCSELLEELAWSASIIEVLRRVYAGSTNPMIRRLSDQCHQRIFES